MALSSGTKGFYFRKNMVGDAAHPPLAEFIIANSETITIGDAITLSSGFAAVCGANDRPIGIAEAIVDADGLPVHGVVSYADHDGTVTGDDTYAASNDNQTDKQVKVRVMIPRSNDLFYNDADDTLSQADIGKFYDMNSTGDNIDVASAATPAVWQLVEIDPDGDGDASKGLFRVAEPYLRNV